MEIITRLKAKNIFGPCQAQLKNVYSLLFAPQLYRVNVEILRRGRFTTSLEMSSFGQSASPSVILFKALPHKPWHHHHRHYPSRRETPEPGA